MFLDLALVAAHFDCYVQFLLVDRLLQFLVFQLSMLTLIELLPTVLILLQTF